MKRIFLPFILIACISLGTMAQEEAQDPVKRHAYLAKNFKKTDKVVFSKFLVTFSTAASQAGPLDKEHAKFGTFLEGIPTSVMQQITDSLYAQYTKKLNEMGYQVLDNSAVLKSKSMASWKLEDGPGTAWLADLPYDIQQFGDREVAMCFAKGTPDYRHADLTRLPGKDGKFEDLSNETDAIVISAGFHIYFMDYDPDQLDRTNVVTGEPKLYLASNMQTKLNTQVTFHYWTEKLKEPSMATYWLGEPMYFDGLIGTHSSSKEGATRKELAPAGSTAVAYNVVKADKEIYSKGVEYLLERYSETALKDWELSIQGK